MNYLKGYYAHNGLGPYTCYFCESEVTFEENIVHHADHDRKNNTPENLKAAHPKCHRVHHLEDRLQQPAMRQGMLFIHTSDSIERTRAANIGRSPSQDTRQKISAALKGKPKSEETKQRMRAAQRKYRNGQKEAKPA